MILNTDESCWPSTAGHDWQFPGKLFNKGIPFFVIYFHVLPDMFIVYKALLRD
jgi:hypothetical protein